MAVYLCPLFGAGAQLFTDQGVVLAGGTINTYLAGSTTPTLTYIDNTQSTQNATAIALDSAGRTPQEIWLVGGVPIKIIVKNAAGVQVGQTWDNLTGINDPATSGGGTTAEWVASGVTPTYINTTSFSVPGDLRTKFPTGQRVKYVVTAGTAYGTVVSSVFGALTTVTIAFDTTPLDAGLSVVSYGFLTASAPSVDALGVTYKDTIAPPGSPVSIATVLQRVDRANRLVTSTGTGTAYVLTPTPALTAYDVNSPFLVKFNVDSGAAPTMNVSTIGAKNLKQINAAGTKVDAVVKAGVISEIVYDGTDLVVMTSSASGRFLRTTIFTAGGTWTKGSDVSFVIAEAVGGGGGGPTSGGTGAGGGGAGGYCRKLVAAPGATEAVTVGAGGVGAADGTSSTFGTAAYITAGGGKQGTGTNGGAGGTATGGDVNTAGNGGGYGGSWSANIYYGHGGGSFFGGGAEGGVNRAAAVSPAANSGAGASGGTGGSGTGGSGLVLVHEYS